MILAQKLLVKCWWTWLQGVTAEKDGDNSFLKYCEWKGVSVPCAAIFKTFPTERGICCSFNMAAAKDLFIKSTYSDLVQNLQTKDMQGIFLNRTVLNSSSFDAVHTAEPGTNQGFNFTNILRAPKFFAQLFSTYILALKFFVKRILAQ